MQVPRWVLQSVVLKLHEQQIEEHGGEAGVRDFGLLESALARPKNLWHYAASKPDYRTLAASYAYGIGKNHPFYDGNKRTAAVVCEGFLLLNGYKIIVSDEEWAEVIYQLSAGTIGEDRFKDWLISKTKPA